MKLPNRLDHPQVKKHFLISALGLSIGLLLYYYLTTSTIAHTFSKLEALLSSWGGILLAYMTYAISIKLDKWVPWKIHLASRFLVGILIHFLIAFALIVFLYFVYTKLASNSVLELAQSALIKLAIILLLLMLTYQLFYFALYSYYTYATLQIERVKKEHQQIDLQLKALKSQLSAHFLFNNLNTISALAFKDAKIAEKYIRGLATIYKYSLKSYPTKLVLLQEELAIVRAYLLLLKTRYGDFIRYSIDIPTELYASKVPPLTLQMLLENAVKHNSMDGQNRLRINLYAVADGLVVKNNITKTPKDIVSFNIGLRNIESRYQLMNKQGMVVSNDTHFTVKIPLLK